MFRQAPRIKMPRTCIILLCTVFLSFSVAYAAEFSLIVEPEGHQAVIHAQKADEKGMFRSAARWRRVNLLRQLALTDGIAKGDELVLNLFPDTSYHAMIDRVSVNVQGTTTVRGRLRNYPLGYVLVSTTGDLSLASIRVPELGAEYTIVYDPDSRPHYLVDNDPLKLNELEDLPAAIPPPPKPEEQPEIGALQERVQFNQVANDATATIDVMVVYTPAARVWANSNEGSISNVIAQAMEKAQLAADNSGTSLAIRLVYSAEVAYTESGDSGIDLYRLQGAGDGYLDSVHALRNNYGADVVVLFTRIDDAGGIGYLLDSPFGSPAYAFSITRVQQASWTYTTVHEIGHNMGLGHHKDQIFQPGPGLDSYSAGWRWVSTNGGRYCSVMTYSDGSYFSDGLTHTRLPYFSNPSVTYIGAATGDAANGDNARTIRETKNVVAAYRQAQAAPSCSYAISPPSALFSSSDNTGTVIVTTTADCSWSAASNALWLTITAGSAGTGNGTVSYSLSANATGGTRTATMTIGGKILTVTQNGDTGTTLYFPHVDTSFPWQTEVAVINTSLTQSAAGTLKAFNDDGQLIETRTLTLPARGRAQIVVSSEFTHHSDIGYMIFESSTATVQGYMKFTIEGTYRAAIPAVKEVNTSDIYIPHIDSSAQWWTGVSLVNTTSTTKELTITFNNGLSVPYTLNAKQHKTFTIGSLLNQPLQPGIRSAVITNASGIVGLELFGRTVGMNQMDGILLTDNTAPTLYYPHVARDGWRTDIAAYNPSELACTMTITPYNSQGTSLSPTTTISLAGKEKYTALVTELGLPVQTAWFKIDSTRPLSGFAFFRTADDAQLAAYTGEGGTGAKAGVFAKIEKNGWTGIAFVNTEDSAASVTLTAYSDNGSVVATRVLPVSGHAKVVDLAENFFSGQNIGSATYIAYSSNRNVVGFQINGSADDTLLDGLPVLAN
jgi:hypothetical protein